MRLLVNMANGQTHRFTEVDEVLDLFRTSESHVRGLTLVDPDGVHHALPRPAVEGHVRWGVRHVFHRDESGRIVGDEIACYAAGVRICLLLYRGRRPKMAVTTLERTGTPVLLADVDVEAR